MPTVWLLKEHRHPRSWGGGRHFTDSGIDVANPSTVLANGRIIGMVWPFAEDSPYLFKYDRFGDVFFFAVSSR